MKLTQLSLIRKIIAECGLETELKQYGTLAVMKILHKEEEGPLREAEWKYRMIIGMPTYLSVSLQPDIAFTVHQYTHYI